MKALFWLLGALCVLGGIAAGIYVGIFVFLVPGIVDVIEGAKADPVDSGAIAWGVAKILLAELAAGVVMWFGILVGVFFIKMTHD